jgi:hypothetical protein
MPECRNSVAKVAAGAARIGAHIVVKASALGPIPPHFRQPYNFPSVARSEFLASFANFRLPYSHYRGKPSMAVNGDRAKQFSKMRVLSGARG